MRENERKLYGRDKTLRQTLRNFTPSGIRFNPPFYRRTFASSSEIEATTQAIHVKRSTNTMINIFRVVKQGEPIQIPSQKAEGGQLTKSMITLQEIGSKYANTYLCTMFGNTALCKWTPGEIVFASLRFEVREHNGNSYQDIVVNEIISLKNN